MSLPSLTLLPLNDDVPADTSNVRLVAIGDNLQPQYLVRVAELERAMVAAAAEHGVGPKDIPGLYGLCVEAVRAAERQGR